ncbi:winged helix DNA-binding domain-containing protein [Glaciihabitans sp. INWT7]|uniref:winged helix DNA-binding domain-containing protein n=1 Tax=Glaciihabitans sp. INWT7 TaxID=2596912 RepID=UPI001626DDA6|nr:winged helix DNA-binding domain-containing protein [Glaciihabitans sp. INWT7]QNE47001.1 winged helix DNA-binding domain-containing protein [Glaciihabitans sp. INWT7]
MAAAPTVISGKDLLGRRLACQLIGGDTDGSRDVASTVRRLFATQSQDFAQSLWGIGLRTPGAHRCDVLAAMESGSIVRSSSLRGTLMMVAAEDLRAILSLTAERTIASSLTRQRQLELDEATMSHARTVLETTLAGRNALPRAAVLQKLEDAGIRTDAQRGYHILWLLAERGIVCWGPPRGTQQGLVLLEEWIAAAPFVERDEHLRRFVVRYFAGHGPATIADLAWWGRLTIADVRRGIASAGDELCEVTADGTEYWMTADQPAGAPAVGTVALPGFDEYLLGYSDRSAALSSEHVERVVPGTNGLFLPTIVAAGRVIGTWRRTVVNGEWQITPEPFDALTRSQARAFEASAQAYREFVSD